MNALGRIITTAYALRALAARSLSPDDAPPAAEAQSLRQNGVVVLPAAIPPASLDAVVAENAALFERPEETIFSPDGVRVLEGRGADPAAWERYYFLHIRSYQRRLDVYKVIDPVLRPILRAHYRSPYYFREIVCYRSQPVPDGEQGSYAWHRDNYPPGGLKVMVYLTDVLSEEQGPLVYALGTHLGFEPELGLYGPRIPRNEVEGRHELLPCLGPRGTVILFDNNGIHRASNPRSGRREVINATIFPCVSKTPPAVAGLELEAERTWLKRYTR